MQENIYKAFRTRYDSPIDKEKPVRTIEERQQALQEKRAKMQAIVDLRAQGKKWYDIAKAVNLNSHARAMQLYKEAMAEGMTPTSEAA